jgi:hypothetical protein
MSYLTRFLEISGFMGKPTDKTDKTPLEAPETEVSSVLSVPSPRGSIESAPIHAPDPEPKLLHWAASNLTADEMAALNAIMSLPPGAPWPALGEQIEAGRRHNEAVLARRGRT